jgi:hypothetical protein
MAGCVYNYFIAVVEAKHDFLVLACDRFKELQQAEDELRVHKRRNAELLRYKGISFYVAIVDFLPLLFWFCFYSGSEGA